MAEDDFPDLAETFAVEPSGYFGPPACRKGLDILPGRYVQPHWLQRESILGRYGPDRRWHLSKCCPVADVSVLNGLVHGPSIRLMLNQVNRRCVGMVTADDIEAVHGIAVRLLRISAGVDARAKAECIVGETVTRLMKVNAPPILIFGVEPREVYLF